MRKRKVYVETSVWGAVFDAEPAYYREAARKLLSRADDFEFYISPVVGREITNAPREIRERLRGVITDVDPLPLDETEEIIALTAEYVSRGIFPAKYRNDALHVAFASYYALEFLVSYNFRHIVRVSRRELVRAANTVLGFHTPIILSPEELAEERWEE
jgi:predicted nucleic acid-binding protein